MTNTNDWIRDIDLDPRIIRDLADAMSDAIEDRLNTITQDIAIAYCDDEYLDTDEGADEVLNPLYDRLLSQVVNALLPGVPHPASGI